MGVLGLHGEQGIGKGVKIVRTHHVKALGIDIWVRLSPGSGCLLLSLIRTDISFVYFFTPLFRFAVCSFRSSDSTSISRQHSL
jgi:hypothetical protein